VYVEWETALKRRHINQGLITRDSAVVYPNFIHFHQQNKHRRTQPLAAGWGWHNYSRVLNKVMMNGPIQTKTKEFLLLQFHARPPCLPVCVCVGVCRCVCGASLVWKERRRSRFNFPASERQIDGGGEREGGRERENTNFWEKSRLLWNDSRLYIRWQKRAPCIWKPSVKLHF